MNRSTALVLVGVVLLTVAASLPVIQLLLTDWDTDYVYTVETDGGLCADRVAESSTVENGDFRVAYGTLSPAGQRQVKRALAEGRHVVENETAAASDFEFADDYEAAGLGCYAVRYENETYPVATERVSTAIPPLGEPWPSILGWLLVVCGGGSLFAGSVLTVRHRFESVSD